MYHILIIFWFPCTAAVSSRRAVSGVALVTNASIGIKLEPLANIGYLLSIEINCKKFTKLGQSYFEQKVGNRMFLHS